MRIYKIQLAGLAAAMIGATAGSANAEDLTISTATTNPVRTSDPVAAAPVEAGNVTIAAGGSITVTAGPDAVTVDSNNNVTNSGAINANDANNVTGILNEDCHTSTINNGGSISLLETYVLADTDSDGDLDGTYANPTSTNRHGIHLLSGLAHTGDITNGGSITVEGNNSSGITLDAALTGNLTSSGNIVVTGDNSVGVAINGGVTGDVILRGNGTIRGAGSSGIVVDSVINGDLIVNGGWSVTGFHNINRPADVSHLDADDTQLGGSALVVRQSVTGGVRIEGLGVEDDVDDDGDGVTEAGGDTNDDLSAVLFAYGSAPTVLIESDGVNNLVLGTTSTGYGFHVQGTVAGLGIYDNIDATAILIAGNGASTVSIADGVTIDGTVQASGANANARALVIGSGASVSEVLLRRSLGSTVNTDLVRESQGLRIESGATVPIVSNTGVIRSQLFGESGSATAIIDLSGTVTTINNTGIIAAEIIATDADATDNVPPPPVTGQATAIDTSAMNTGVTLNQTADVPFNDSDTVDDDAASRPDPMILGRIMFGGGVDTINLLDGGILGDVSFGAGADVFNIDNGAVYAGHILDSDGALTISVQDGTLSHAGGATNLTTATFGADSILGVTLSATPVETTFLHASGAITFDPGAQIIPVVPQGLPTSGTHLFLTADGGLNGAANVTGAVTGVGAPFLYNLSINTVLGDPNSLEAAFLIKTAAQLGLNTNQATALDPIIEALRLDDAAADAFGALSDAGSFFDAYTDLMPSYASASTELAATAIQQMQSATTNRMAHTRLQGLDEVSAWVQEIGYSLERTPLDANGQEFSGQGFGMAVGIDGPLDNGALFGLSASFLASEEEEPDRPEGEISSWFGQGNAYFGTALGPVDLDFVAGAGFGRMRERRFVQIGPSFSAQTEAEWWAYEGHGAARASAPLSLGNWLVITPQAQLTYVGLSEQGYTESGGGAAIDIEADDSFSQRLWGDAGVEFSGRWNLRSGGMIAPRIYAGYRSNMIDEEAERTFRFVSGGADFTLTDEPLGDGGPLVGVGIDATNGYSTLSLSYEGEFGDQIERHSLNAALRFRF